MGSGSNQVDVISLIINTQLISLSGSWNIEKITGEKKVVSNGLAISYDYLVRINNINHLIYPGDIACINEVVECTLTGRISEFSIRLISAQGETKMLSGKGSIKPKMRGFTTARQAEGNDSHQNGDWLGNTYGIVFPDDDTRRLAVENLIAGKNLMEAVFNTSALALHVLQSIRNEEGDIADFHILLTNATSEKIAGRKVSGMRMLEGWPHTKEIGLFEKFVQVVKTGKKMEYEHPYQADGVKAWFHWIASPLNDGLYVTIEDITQRKTAEEALKETADRLQSIFDGVPAMIALLEVVYDDHNQPVDFIVSAANKAMVDFTPAEGGNIIGKRMTELYPKTFHGKLLESHVTVFKTGEPRQFEILYTEIDRWFSLFLTKQVDGHGLVAAAVEITALKKGEEQSKHYQMLTELNAAKTEFFSNVSHEFRTPLTLMLGPLQDMLKTLSAGSDNADTVHKLEMVYRNALRLEKLVNTLLHFSRIEAGRSDAIFKPVDLSEYTTLLAGNFRSAIQHAGLGFVVDCESTEPIYVNPDMWEKIVLNLLSNAFKFTFSGKIEIKLKSYKKHVRLQVRDTGIGIHPSYHLKIFEKFTRIPSARSRSNEGTGIGLALVNEFVKIHRGNIEISSQQGAGTTFTVSIPKGKAHLPRESIYEMRDKSAVSPLASVYAYEAMSWFPDRMATSGKEYTHASINPESEVSAMHQKATVLLVDDNSDIREYIKSILGHEFIVATAHNGVKALELIATGLRPHLVLADLMMPEMDGYTLMSKIRENDEISGAPFIMLSARASEEDRLEGMRNGVDDYLVKPFSSVALLALVNSRIKRAYKAELINSH